MDRRIFILPIASALLLLVLLARPDITGLIVANPSGQEANEAISNLTVTITISQDGFIPDGSYVLVNLDDRNVTMDFADFVRKSGGAYNFTRGEAREIGYEGLGWGGSHTYSLDISQFGVENGYAGNYSGPYIVYEKNNNILIIN